MPVIVSPDEVERVRGQLGELPAALRARLESTYKLDAYDADVLVNQGPAVVEYFETVANTCREGKRASNWIQQDVLRTLKEREIPIEAFPVNAESLAELILKVQQGISTTPEPKTCSSR